MEINKIVNNQDNQKEKESGIIAKKQKVKVLGLSCSQKNSKIEVPGIVSSQKKIQNRIFGSHQQSEKKFKIEVSGAIDSQKKFKIEVSGVINSQKNLMFMCRKLLVVTKKSNWKRPESLVAGEIKIKKGGKKGSARNHS